MVAVPGREYNEEKKSWLDHKCAPITPLLPLWWMQHIHPFPHSSLLPSCILPATVESQDQVFSLGHLDAEYQVTIWATT